MSLFSDSTKTSDYSTPKLAKRPTRNSRSKELINHRCPFRRPYSIVKGVMVLSFKIPHRWDMDRCHQIGSSYGFSGHQDRVVDDCWCISCNWCDKDDVSMLIYKSHDITTSFQKRSQSGGGSMTCSWHILIVCFESSNDSLSDEFWRPVKPKNLDVETYTHCMFSVSVARSLTTKVSMIERSSFGRRDGVEDGSDGSGSRAP